MTSSRRTILKSLAAFGVWSSLAAAEEPDLVRSRLLYLGDQIGLLEDRCVVRHDRRARHPGELERCR